MTSSPGSARGRCRVRRTGVLITGGVLAAVAATAVATSVAPAPAQALDACISSALGTLKSGSASCSASGALSVAIAIGANTTATVAGGWFNLAFAVGDDSVADTTPVATYSNFSMASAWSGGYAVAGDGNFNIATAVLSDSVAAAGGDGLGTTADFGVAQAFGNGALALTGAQAFKGLPGFSSAFNVSRALGTGAQAFATNGNFLLSSALGSNTLAVSGALFFGRAEVPVVSAFNVARAIGNDGTNARALGGFFLFASARGSGAASVAANGNFNAAGTIGVLSRADAQDGSGNIAGTIGTLSSARAGGNFDNPTGNNRNSVLVFGDNSTATAGVPPYAPAGAGPVSGRHVISIGNSQSKSDEPAAISSQRSAPTRSAAAKRP